MVKVSVIVPVFNPGADIDECLASLLGQTMPAGECELIFVDDGSTDGTPARLDALAAEHAHVRVEHIPNSGWPGRPRNVGLDLAQGEFAYFVDNDDWLGPEALARLHAAAVADEADVVVGKVVGHGKYVTRGIFVANAHDLTVADAPFGLLTPHKLFRTSMLREHDIRFPEGRRRLEDHVFVVRAYFAAARIAVLADYACYHWVRRGDGGGNASYQQTDPADYYRDVREVLDIIDAHTEPGDFRDRLYGRWYRGKLLGRVGRGSFHRREPEYRERLFAEVRGLVDERFPPRLDENLPYALGLRAQLLRASDVEGIAALAAFEDGLAARAPIKRLRGDGTWLTLRCRGRLWSEAGGPLLVERREGRVHFVAPVGLEAQLAGADRDVTRRLSDGQARIFLRSEADETEWELPTESVVRVPEAPDGEPVRPVVSARARIAPTIAAGGGPLPPGEYDVRVVVSVAGFSAVARVKDGEEPLTLTVTPAHRMLPSSAPRPIPAAPPPPPEVPDSARRTAFRTAVRVPGLLPTVRRAKRRVAAAR